VTKFADQYAIVGLGSVIGPHPEVSGRAMQAEAARLAIEDAGLVPSDIDGALDLKRQGGGGDRPGYTDSFARMLGLPVNFYYSIGRGGSIAGLGIATALGFLQAGLAKYVVCSNFVEDWSNSRKTRAEGKIGMAHTPRRGHYGTPFGDLRAVSHHSFFASRHMHEYGTTSEQLGAIAVAQRQWACMNPDARMYGRPITIEDHQASEMVVDPYHLLDLCQVSDGAVSFVLTTADRAEDTRSPVYLKGIGFGEAMASLWWEKRNYTELAVKPAKEAAFAHAGIELADIGHAQLYDCFTGEVLFQLEDYGWAEKGAGGEFVASGATAPGGSIPVNTSGGLLSAYHFGDLTGTLEAVTQLRKEAGDRQVDANYSLVSGHGGEILSPGMCSIHSTLIFGTKE